MTKTIDANQHQTEVAKMLYRAETRFSGTFCWDAKSIADFLVQLHKERGTTDDVVSVCEVTLQHDEPELFRKTAKPPATSQPDDKFVVMYTDTRTNETKTAIVADDAVYGFIMHLMVYEKLISVGKAGAEHLRSGQQRLALVLASLCVRNDARCSDAQPCPACLQFGTVIEVTVDDSTVVRRQHFDRPSVEVGAAATQSVQRCYSRSDRRYGNVHRLDRNAGDMTACGLYVASRTWWLLGDETDYPVTCRACQRKPTHP